MGTANLTIAERYCGPSQTGNGGYVGGLLSGYLPGTASVKLIKGVPLGVEMRVEIGDSDVRLMHGNALIAELRPAHCDTLPPDPPSFAEAKEASKSFVGFGRHAFPDCIVCGTNRAEGDGLRIFPGPVSGRSLVAAPWVPDRQLDDGTGRVKREFLWAPLECTGAFAWYPNLIVMGELTVRLDGALQTGEKCVVAGWQLGSEGRKFYAGSAVYSETGEPVAIGRATWIEISRDAFVTLSRTGKSDP